MSADSPVAFLLGVPRSGTTLLSQLLQAHPHVTSPPEPWLLLALESFGRAPSRHPADSQLLAIAIDELFERIDKSHALRALADDVYRQYSARCGALCFVDKTPRYWLILDFLESLYPDAPSIVLLRNPYAIAASLKNSWGIRLSLDSICEDHAPYIADLALGVKALLEHAERRPALLMHYESLVRAPATEQARALSYLGHLPSFLNAPGAPISDESGMHTSFGDTKIRERRTVDSSSLDAWKEALDPEEVRAVTELVGVEVITRLGYGDALEAAALLGASLPSTDQTRERRLEWSQWLATNRAVAAQASSWPSVNNDLEQQIKHLQEQAARDHAWALNSERLLRECNHDRQELRTWAEDAELRASKNKFSDN